MNKQIVYNVGRSEEAPAVAMDIPESDPRLREFYQVFWNHGKSREPMIEVWQPPPMYLVNPKRRADFYTTALGGFAVSDSILKDQVMVRLLQNSGELLPLPVAEAAVQLYHFNPTTPAVVDCLDERRSVRSPVTKVVKKPELIADRVPRGRLFCLPKMSVTLVSPDESVDLESDFFRWYHHRGYKGLKFVPFWTESTQP